MVRILLFVFAGLLVFAVAPRAQAADKVETQSVIYNSKRAELSSSALIKLMKDKLDTAYQDLELVVTSCGGGEVASRAGGANGLAGNWSVSTSTDIDHCNTTISGNKKDGGNFNIGGSVFNGWLPAWISKLTADGNKVSNKALFDYATAEKQKILPGSTPQYNSSGNVADNMTLHGGEKSNHAILFQTTGYTKVLNGVVPALQAAGYTNAEINQMPDDQLTWAGFGEALDALRKQIDANPGKEKAFIDIQAHGGKAEKTVAYAPGKFGQAGGGAVVSAANPVLPITVNDPVALAQLGQDLPKPGGGDYYEDPTIARYGPATLFFSTLAEILYRFGRCRRFRGCRRTFAAPLERVFAAWAEPDQLKQWMCGDVPSHVITQHVQEIRTGGRWKTEIHDPAKNEVYWGRGVYREVKPLEKIVFTWFWTKDNPDGENMHPGSEETVVTVEFFARGGNQTEIVLTHSAFANEAQREDHNRGWNGCFDALEKLLAS